MAEENILKVLSESLKIQLMSCMYKPRDFREAVATQILELL